MINVLCSDNQIVSIKRGGFKASLAWVKNNLSQPRFHKKKANYTNIWETVLSSERVAELLNRETVTESVKKTYAPNTYQQNIIDHVLASSLGSVNIVSADAGTGKTSLLCQIADNVKDTTILAYNKDIADEIKLRGYNGFTFHAYGLQALKSQVWFRVDKYKYINLVKTWLDETELKAGLHFVIADIFQYSRESLSREYSEVVAEFNVNYKAECESRIFNLVDNLYLTLDQELKNGIKSIDITDMVYLPVILNTPLPYAEILAIDECQDINALKLAFIEQYIQQNPKSKIVFVGDSKQAINGWIGAYADGLSMLAEKYNTQPLPLPLTYRTPINVLNYIKSKLSFVATITASKIQGQVNDITLDDLLTKKLDHNDMILCLHNAPLIALCLKLQQNGIKAKVKGQNIGTALTSILRSINADYERLDEQLGHWLDEKIKPNTRPATKQKWQDQINTILAVADQCTTISEIYDTINKLFDDYDQGCVQMSSVHRAKGLEAENVYIIKPELLQYTKTDDNDQNVNLTYVALTRTQNTLTFVHEPK